MDSDELSKQREAVVAAMKNVQSDLDDKAHAKVTNLLVEMTAFNIMSTLHELTSARGPS